MRKSWSIKQKKAIVLCGITLFVILMVLAVVLIGRPILHLAEDPELFREWIDARGWYGWILFTLMIILQVFVAVIPGEALELAAGYAFGALEGTVLCIIGETIGGMLVFLFVRKFGVQAVETFFSMEKIHSLRFLQNPKKRNILFLLLFLLPGTPKDLLCYAAGLTGIPAAGWFGIQCIGRLPSIMTSTLGGNALGEEKYLAALIVLAVTAMVSGIGLILYRIISKRENKRHDNKE
ncbi:MAG: TVP38/TMEM64 family protein [Clostridia bacterium]|nr:TVP38/TMEM64 family protein [Clostridia bacterium]